MKNVYDDPRVTEPLVQLARKTIACEDAVLTFKQEQNAAVDYVSRQAESTKWVLANMDRGDRLQSAYETAQDRLSKEAEKAGLGLMDVGSLKFWIRQDGQERGSRGV